MKVIYVGDASNLHRRIRQHGRGNVEGSALRKHVAEALGYGLARTRRPSGSTRTRIDVPDPREAEQEVSDSIAGGAWRWVVCDSKAEAQALQWAAIEALDPLLNRARRAPTRDERHPRLIAALRSSPLFVHSAFDPPATPGVYALYHEHGPAGLTRR